MRQKTHSPVGVLRHVWCTFIRRNRDRDIFVALLFAYLIAFVTLTIHNQFGSFFSRMRVSDYAAGRIAEEDLVLEHDITYADEQATQLKREAKAGLVLPVFIVNKDISARVLDRFDSFSAVYLTEKASEVSEEKLFFEVQSSLPGVFGQEAFLPIARYADPEKIVKDTRSLLVSILTRGYASLPHAEDAGRPMISDRIEIWRWDKGHQWKEQIPLSDLVIKVNLPAFIGSALTGDEVTPDQVEVASLIIDRIAEENTFFDEVQTEKNRVQAMAEVQPVMKRLLKGERIIRKGFLITEEDMREVAMLLKYSVALNLNSLLGTGFFLILLFVLAFVFFNPPLITRPLSKNNIYLLTILASVYLILSVILLKTVSLPDWLPASLLLPTGLIAMLACIFIGAQASVSLVTIISLSLLLVTKMDVFATVFAFLSGIAGIVVIRNAEKRIELIRAGSILGFLNISFIIVLGLFRNFLPANFLIASLWGFMNGFLCGVFNLGFLPILEHFLNSPTRFRLMELSDLNSPILKRMLTLAPGTYSHSVNVANLAESACTEIGANALLARVGAYYHDIGKIDQAEYFIENQTSYNKHDELKPSLSVAVIKSHVKIGVEKAREISLPREVIEIIAQHHGRGLITYFYQRALERDGEERVSPEDFSYTGNPPGSKEAAVVMLADAVEAASRTLKRPTVSKLEKFVWTVILDKFNAGQLNECDLTFRNLETIKRTFVQILAGHFHSRIEYPKVKESQR